MGVAFPNAVQAADRSATPSTFASVWSSAQPGDRVLLASGSYGTFGGGVKAGVVTITPEPGATATMRLSFNGARNIRLDRLTIPEATFLGTTRDVTVANSRFTGMAVVRADEMSNANIVFDGNTHAGINVCGSCYEGRLEVVGQGPGPSGVTIKNSVFGPGGDADGVQIAADGVRVLDNEFTGIRVIGPVHSDALQLYGASNTVIRGNYFHDNDVGIMAPDGGENELITDNVFVGGGYRPAVQLGSHIGTQFVHNTVRNIDVYMDRKTENTNSPSRNGVIRDNVFVNGSIGGYSTSSSYCSDCTFSNNLFSSSGDAEGTNAVVGTAMFAGGANPTTYAAWALASGSPGMGSASDGTDLGIRAGGGPAPTPTPIPTPTPTPTPTPSPTPTPAPDTAAEAIWSAPNGAQVGKSVTLDATGSKGDAPVACTWSFENQDGSTVWETATGCKITKTFQNADTKYVRLTVTDKDGDSDQERKSFAVSAAPAPSPTPSPSPTPPPTPQPSPGPAPSPAPEAPRPPLTTPAPSRPVAAYGFDERRSGRAADSSGNRNDGAIAGAKRTKGRHGRALKFDGRDDVVTVPDADTLALTDAITLEAWLRPSSRDRRWRTVLVKSRGGEIAYALYASDPHRRPTAVAGAARASATRQGAELRPGRWNHLAVTYNGEALRIYVNGELAAVQDRTGLLPLAAGPLLIGGDRRRGHAFRGAIDDVRVYGRALDADEIRADMTSGA